MLVAVVAIGRRMADESVCRFYHYLLLGVLMKHEWVNYEFTFGVVVLCANCQVQATSVEEIDRLESSVPCV